MAGREGIDFGESRLRLQTLIRLRWVAVLGQTVTVLGVHFGLGFALPLGLCLTVIGMSAVLNVVLQICFPASKRLKSTHAMLTLGFDLLQLSVLLYLTGGLQNPFALLIVVPVAVSASTQPLQITVILCALAVACTSVLVLQYMPLPWPSNELKEPPLLYMLGIWTALICCIVFMATYAWRTAQETRMMSDALAATELLLAREQKLSALDGLAAAAAHELGTPLATITLVAKELQREIPEDSPFREDIQLLRTQTARCRDILGTLAQNTGETDAVFSKMSLGHLIEEVIEPYRIFEKEIQVDLRAPPEREGQFDPEPIIARNAGIIYALTNLVENAVDYASSKVDIVADWTKDHINIAIIDDGPGFASHIMRRLGEPYVTTRPRLPDSSNDNGSEGMGLGCFIAKTLLERTNATLRLENREPHGTGAIVRVTLNRHMSDAVWSIASIG